MLKTQSASPQPHYYVSKLRSVAIVGSYRRTYARHAILREGLEALGIEVEERNLGETLQGRTPDHWRHLWDTFPWVRHTDVILIPAFNQLVAPLAWVLSKRYGKSVWLDYMIGLTDMQADRQSANAAKRFAFRQVDRFNLTRLPSFTDTRAHRDELGRLLNIQTSKIHVVPVGVQDMNMLSPPNLDEPLVQYAGTYIPFHAVEIILHAAQQLPDVPFEFIGKGQTYPAMRQLAADLALDNVTFVEGYFEQHILREMQARSTIMLGVFGDSPKTDYVIPNKVYEALALGRPIITAEATALHEYLDVGEHLITVPPNNADALAKAIQSLLADRQKQAFLRTRGRLHIDEHLLPRHIGVHLKNVLEGKATYD